MLKCVCLPPHRSSGRLWYTGACGGLRSLTTSIYWHSCVAAAPTSMTWPWWMRRTSSRQLCSTCARTDTVHKAWGPVWLPDWNGALFTIWDLENLGPVWISDKTSYHKIQWRFGSCEINSLNHRIAVKFDRNISCCRWTCQISGPSYNFRYKSDSRLCEIWKIRCLNGYWNRAQL